MTGEQRLVVGRQEVEQRHPRPVYPTAAAPVVSSSSRPARIASTAGSPRRPRPCSGCVGPLVGRAHLLAVVAAVDACAERLPMSPRERPRRLHQPGQAATGVDHAGSDDRRGRAPVDAATARPAPIGDRRLVGRQRRAGHDAAEHEPRTGSGTEEVGVLPEPAQPCPVRDLPVDQAVVVGQHPSPIPVPLSRAATVPRASFSGPYWSVQAYLATAPYGPRSSGRGGGRDS